jgi:hypothetical protein
LAALRYVIPWQRLSGLVEHLTSRQKV